MVLYLQLIINIEPENKQVQVQVIFAASASRVLHFVFPIQPDPQSGSRYASERTKKGPAANSAMQSFPFRFRSTILMFSITISACRGSRTSTTTETTTVVELGAVLSTSTQCMVFHVSSTLVWVCFSIGIDNQDQRWAAYVDSRTATLLQRLTQWIFIGEEDTFSDWHVDPQGTGAWLYLIAGEKEWEIECAGGDEPSSRPLIKGATKTELVPRQSSSFRHSVSSAQRSRTTSTKAQRPASCAGASFIEESRAIPTSSQPASRTENVDNRCFVYRFRQRAHQMLYLPAGHWHRARNVTRTAAISHNFLEDEEEFLAELQQAVKDDDTSGEGDHEKEREPLLLGALQGLRSEIRNALLETNRKMN